MADYNNPNGTSVNSVNTNSIAIFGADGTMLRLGFKNDMMFLSIIPKIMDPNTGKPKWPREMSKHAALRPAQAAALYNGFMQKLLPDIESKTDHMGYVAVSLNLSGTTLCGFGYVGGMATFSIFNNVSADRTCNEVSTYTFEATPIINAYNPNTGTFEVDDTQAQLFIIVWALRNFAEMCSNYTGHGAKMAMTYNLDMIMSNLQSMCVKLGVTPSAYGSYRGQYNGYGNGFTNNFAAPQGGYTNDGPDPSATAGQAPLMQPSPIGENATTSWGTGYTESATVGHNAVTAVQQVSSLEELMG